MKFLCPSCKAKYQIADEKVSGRAVRMKCRKCGYIIPISEVPPAPPTINPPGGIDALPPVPRPPLAPRGLEPPPSSRPAPRPVAAPGTPGPSPKPAPVRPGSPAVLATKKGIGVAPPVAKLVPSGGAADPREKARSSSELLSAFEDEEEQATAIVSGGALAAAFGALVSQTEIKAAPDHAMPGDEWYVGINDVPVGPIRLAEIRKKAAVGAIGGDSLVWRDGLEDWRPFRTFPELMAVLEESLSSIGLKRPPVPVGVPGDGAAKAEFGDFGTPFPSGVTGVGVVTDDLAAAGLARSRIPVAAWIAIAVALLGGLGLGFVIWSRQKPPEVVYRYRDRPSEEAPAPVAAGAQDPAALAPGADSAGAKPRPGGKPGGTKPIAATNGDKGGGLSGLKGLDGLRPGGPAGNSPGSTTPTSAGGGSQLDSGQIQATVSRYTGSVKRSCWQPALDSRDPSAPASARVQVTITVGPSGSVQNATTNGDPRGYPGLANCIAGRVRSWQFPPSSGSTTAVVPFVFAAQ